jgi:Cu-processing system permease protein
MSPLRSLCRFELAAARKSRTVALFALGFAIATGILTLTGLSSGGLVAVQGFARTSMSLMQLVLWVVPLLGLLLGASVGAESLELEFQVSLPVQRFEIVLARWLAWLAVLGGAMTLGLSVAGILISVSAGSGDEWRYFRLLGVSNLLLAASLAIGMMLGVLARSRIRAMGFAVVAWVVMVIGVDLVAIGALAILPRGEAGWGLTLLLMLDPADSARALAIGLLQADIVSGPTGAAIRKVLGGWGLWALTLSLLLWTSLPLYAAARRFRRLDL